jgi:hypothetical protein
MIVSGDKKYNSVLEGMKQAGLRYITGAAAAAAAASFSSLTSSIVLQIVLIL